jgi:hypothetical protein
LLEEDKFILDIDFRLLGNAPAVTRQAWLAEMEAARSAAVSGYFSPGHDPSDATQHLPFPVDTEGSIRFRRRRRQSGLIKHCVCLISLSDEVYPYGPGCCSACVEKKGGCPWLAKYLDS